MRIGCIRTPSRRARRAGSLGAVVVLGALTTLAPTKIGRAHV